VEKYITGDTTNFLEYVNSLEGILIVIVSIIAIAICFLVSFQYLASFLGLFNLKVKQNTTVESYSLIAFYVSGLINAGLDITSLIVRKLGLPWESMQDAMLTVRKEKREFHSERKSSEQFLAQRSNLTRMRKLDTEKGRKDQCYKSVESAIKHQEQKEQKAPQLIEKKRARSDEDAPIATPTKKICSNAWVPGQFLFAKFGDLLPWNSSWFRRTGVERASVPHQIYSWRNQGVIDGESGFSRKSEEMHLFQVLAARSQGLSLPELRLFCARSRIEEVF
jgi:hypothetical protein